MIGRITKAVKSVEDIDALRESIEKSTNALQKAVTRVESVEKKLQDESEARKEAFQKLEKQHTAMLQSSERVIKEFEKELASFKTLKSQLQTEVITRVTQDIKKEVQTYITNIKDKMEELHSASKEIHSMSERTGKVLHAMDSVVAVSSGIKKQDFELHKYARVLEQNDREKLALMKRIDSLERLVSQMRRNQKTR
ncbi:MAG: hypothetical protein ACMXYE_04225 [Candidatus Woesearchaeota archaeon]